MVGRMWEEEEVEKGKRRLWVVGKKEKGCMNKEIKGVKPTHEDLLHMVYSTAVVLMRNRLSYLL